MPVIGIPVHMLMERISTRLDRDQLAQHLQHLGCDMEGFATVRRFRCLRCDNLVEITESEKPPVVCDRCGVDYRESPDQLVEAGELDVVRMELLPVRPDMFDAGGLARVLRGYLEEILGPARYDLASPRCSVTVDPAVATDVCPRPFIACAVVRGITLNDDLIKVIMKLQENLHWAMGRDRKKASIGVYDLDTVQEPAFSYRSVGPDELSFVPLGYEAGHELTPRQILQEHPKGVAYARLLDSFKRYPLLSDSEGTVLSMPPIINSEPTRVHLGTSSFFIDVTGTEERRVSRTLNVITTSISELDPAARIEQVEIRYPERTVVTPDLTPQEVTLGPTATARLLGLDLDTNDVIHLLSRMGHGIDTSPDGALQVHVPAYRNDVMHPVDLMEDVAIAYGYHNVVPQLVPSMTVAVELPVEAQKEVARRAMIGLGFMETITLTLSSLEADFDALRLPREDTPVLIDNPISVEQTIVRTTLVPGLLETFGVNANHELPQRIFEVGNITRFVPEAETGARDIPLAAAGAIGPKIDYAAIRSSCEALLRELGWRLEVEADDSPLFIAGRGARVLASRDGDRRTVGRMGELHPEVLENHKLVHPASVFEVDLEKLTS
jgi:phenylalanyl-tRNA synthetase beta chain